LNGPHEAVDVGALGFGHVLHARLECVGVWIQY
jgi:hypothetical protein